ncbi:MAG: DNA-binding protein [Comamonadaceae bacterium]|nr:MAG: DNA-binding protein [Comamonadaceae bacterium]
MDQSIEKLLDDRDVAEMLKVSIDTLAEWRKSDTVQLPFVRLGPRLVRFKRSDVLAFIEAGRQPVSNEA